eukprot:5531023-Amphidinium_carterae.1
MADKGWLCKKKEDEDASEALEHTLTMKILLNQGSSMKVLTPSTYVQPSRKMQVCSKKRRSTRSLVCKPIVGGKFKLFSRMQKSPHAMNCDTSRDDLADAEEKHHRVADIHDVPKEELAAMVAEIKNKFEDIIT